MQTSHSPINAILINSPSFNGCCIVYTQAKPLASRYKSCLNALLVHNSSRYYDFDSLILCNINFNNKIHKVRF